MNNAIIASASLAAGAAASNITGNYYSGTMPTNASWTTSSTSFADGTNSNGNALTQLYANGLSVAAAASNIAGITWTPASTTSAYIIEAIIALYGTATNAGVGASFYDGTTRFAYQAFNQASVADVGIFLPLRGIYVPGTASSVTVKIQLIAASGTAGIQNVEALSGIPVIQWTLVQIA